MTLGRSSCIQVRSTGSRHSRLPLRVLSPAPAGITRSAGGFRPVAARGWRLAGQASPDAVARHDAGKDRRRFDGDGIPPVKKELLG